MGTQQLTIEDCKVRVSLGCSKEERAFSQIVFLTVSMQLPVTKGSTTDELCDTVDYCSILQLVENETQAGQWKLLEKMTFDLCVRCLEAFPMAQAVTFAARKQNTFTSGVGPTVSTSLTREDLR